MNSIRHEGPPSSPNRALRTRLSLPDLPDAILRELARRLRRDLRLVSRRLDPLEEMERTILRRIATPRLRGDVADFLTQRIASIPVRSADEIDELARAFEGAGSCAIALDPPSIGSSERALEHLTRFHAILPYTFVRTESELETVRRNAHLHLALAHGVEVAVSNAIFSEPRLAARLVHIGEDAFSDLTDPPDLSGCTQLESISKRAFANLVAPPNLRNCVHLRTIGESAFCNLTTPPDLSGCIRLQVIGEDAFYSLITPPDLSGCVELRTIGDGAFLQLTAPPDLSGCVELRTIGDGAFFQLTAPPNLRSCSRLETIGRSAFSSLATPPDLSNCTELREIGAFAFYSLGVLPDLSMCTQLQSIGVHAFANVANVSPWFRRRFPNAFRR